MAFKLTKVQEAKFRDMIDTCSNANQALRDFISEEISEPKREEWEEKTEKWQESDKGQAVDSWITQWEEFAENLEEFNETPEIAAE